jgi:hypothetical protein
VTSPWDVIDRDLRALEPVTRAAVRPALHQIGQTVGRSAAGRASWSSRIPATITIDTASGGDRDEVAVHGGGPAAPHAGVFEHGGNPGTFQHPVFGRDVWVTQAARPFLAPAARDAEPAEIPILLGALDTAASSLGFH